MKKTEDSYSVGVDQCGVSWGRQIDQASSMPTTQRTMNIDGNTGQELGESSWVVEESHIAETEKGEKKKET